MLDFDTALANLLAAARRITDIETVPLLSANGRVLAQDIVAPINVPGFDNSAMDGYALNIADFAAPPADFVISQRIAAGEVGTSLAVGEAARIFTGAPIPAGANAVAMQEVCSVSEGRASVAMSLKQGANIRRAGEDIAAQTVVLAAGTRLGAAEIGLAASIGVSILPVVRRLKVALLSTGDELVEPGFNLAAGQIYNSNRYAINTLLQTLGCVVSDFGIVADEREATIALLQKAAAAHDVVVTSGGVSVGEEDHVKAAVEYLGELDLWKIAMKPGKPFAHGRIGDTDFIGLPGNPVSSFVTFLMLVRPFLLARQGVQQLEPMRLPLIAAFDWKKAGDRREFLRVRLNRTGQVELFPRQGSGVLTSMVWSDGLVDLPAGQTIAAGEVVSYLPLSVLC
ncbi:MULTISPECIES: molybdopterin molybdotransferase MoeA [Deefgea]|uniref:Molybdopterin molybdenumtransferase n=1 Tax=Deefgea chitinilytica TaxID=570276 RepID=A0ABS2CCD1_9NEIS|nr:MULTISPECIES: gephyrin-like molybdotransferase Glp [Deefgea]MBM5571702.1 molybdopterin molybdenumtransferase MoeA [Deefgea chitinilytica]MBM9888937.1 molybdopterin molybdotransferase MoeA [Deefgea sp. CFH1-16]